MIAESTVKDFLTVHPNTKGFLSDEYLDKVQDGENVFIEYEGQWFTLVKVEK